MSTSINTIVIELETAMNDKKQFMKDNKSIFDENREFNKRIKELKTSLTDSMKASGETTMTVGGLEIEIKSESKPKHDVELLETMMEDGGKFPEYMQQVSQDASKVVTRKVKRARKNDTEDEEN